MAKPHRRDTPPLLPWPRPLVLACLVHDEHRAGLTTALRDHADVQLVERYKDVRAQVRTTGVNLAAVVLGTEDAEGATLVPFVRELVFMSREVRVVAYLVMDGNRSASIRALAEAGAHEFVFHGVDDRGMMVDAVLVRAQREWSVTAVMRDVQGIFPAALLDILECALLQASNCTTVRQLARLLGTSLTTLESRCKTARAPLPEELLSWSRMLFVCHLLDHTALTVRAIAGLLGYPSDTSLRNMIQARLQVTANEARTTGAMQAVTSALSARLELGVPRAVGRNRAAGAAD